MPQYLVTDAAAWLRRRLGLRAEFSLPRRTRYGLLGLSFIAAAALTATNTVAQTWLDDSTRPVDANQVKPAECASITLVGIGHAGGLETGPPEAAGIAAAAGAALFIGVVTTVGQAVVDSQFDASSNDRCFTQVNQRSVNLPFPCTLNAGSSGQARHRLK